MMLLFLILRTLGCSSEVTSAKAKCSRRPDETLRPELSVMRWSGLLRILEPSSSRLHQSKEVT